MKGHRVRLEDCVLSQEAQAGSTTPRALGEGSLFREMGVGSDRGQASGWQTTLYAAENDLERHALKAVSKLPTPTVGHPDYTSLNPSPVAEPPSVASWDATDTGLLLLLFWDRIKV